MTVFSELLKLYRKGDSKKTPMEDFCTECLAGILRSKSDILAKFCVEVLGLPDEENYHLRTQKSYFTEGGKGIVDMVFESSSVLCFLEMKVHAQEGFQQLQKYDHILREANNRNIQLRYCTLYYDEKKKFRNHDYFAQFRWANIAEFLEIYISEDQLIKEFYQFLKEKRMAGNERFTYEDIIGLQVYRDVSEKINEVFHLITSSLEEEFGSTRGGVKSSYQILNNDRLAIWSEEVLGKSGKSEVLISFNFHGSTANNGPLLNVQLWIAGNNDVYEKFVQAAKQFVEATKQSDEVDFIKDGEGSGGKIMFTKPVADFLEVENQISEMVDWINNKIQKISEFRDDYPDLDWRVLPDR